MASSNPNNAVDSCSSTLRKKQRVGSTSSLSTLASAGAGEPLPKRHRSTASVSFNDRATADVILRLVTESITPPDDATTSDSFVAVDREIYLHSRVLERSKYFAALLSDRWQRQEQNRGSGESSSDESQRIYRFTLTVPPTRESVNHRLMVLQLLYAHDDSDMLSAIDSVSVAINLLPVARELLFEDCVRVCVRFLEAVPWSVEEETKILNLIPYLDVAESGELLARVSPMKPNLCEEMLDGLIISAIHNHPNMAFAKAFVARLLKDFSSRDVARRVLDRAFEKSLRHVKQSVEDYSSPDFRGDHSEMEAIQRMNLHSAMTNGKHLLWLVERMVESRVADAALRVWSEQSAFTSDLQRVFRDDAWRNIAPSFPAIMLRCTSRLVNALASGRVLASKQIRANIVRDWLPVLITCKDSAQPYGPGHKTLHLELEETFLKIISTLPMSDSQDLLQQCLSFSTRNVDDCLHLVDAFTTWFRRANLPVKPVDTE